MGLVGILEAHSALRQRIERLLDFRPPRRAGLSLASGLCVAAFGALALPMGEAPAYPDTNASAQSQTVGIRWTNSIMANDPVQHAQLLYESGHLKEARALLEDAVQEHPDNQQAHYYLDLVYQSQQPETAPTNNLRMTSNSRHWVFDQLNQCRLPRVDWNGLSLQEIVRRLNQEVSANSNSGQHLQFMISDAEAVEPQPARDSAAAAGDAALVTNKVGVRTMPIRFEQGLSDAKLIHLDRIENKLSELFAAETQLDIRSTFVALPEPDAAIFWREQGITNIAARDLSVVLSHDRAQKVLKSMQSIAGCDLLSEPAVTTLNGRQTEIQTVDLKTVLMGLNPLSLSSPGVADSKVLLITNCSLGPVLDIIPNVSPDGRSIQLLALPTIVEFLGYDKPSNSVTVYVGGKPRKIIPPLPRFHTSACTNLSTIPDGQTLVLGGLVSESIVKVKDQVPVLGDIPLLGRMFRAESTKSNKKQVLVFITPTMLDAAGNRIHTAQPKVVSAARP